MRVRWYGSVVLALTWSVAGSGTAAPRARADTTKAKSPEALLAEGDRLADRGAYGEAVKLRVDALQLEARLTLDLRRVDEETKERYYAAADVALVPRHMDAASGAIAEALAYGLEIESWGGEPVDYCPWSEVAEPTAALYRRLLGIADGAQKDEVAA